jgi:uncharacterized BrkB/YihY/UPF0761 family membrane protein
MKINVNLLIGIGLGIAVPIVGYAIIMMIFEQLTAAGWMRDPVSDLGILKRMRTMGVLAIATNLIPFHLSNRKRNFHASRGVLMGTILYAGIWVVYFWESITM